MINRRMFVLGTCAGLLGFNRAEAKTVKLSYDAIRDILRHRIDVEKRATGMAVGVVEGGRRRVIVYGRQDSDHARPVAANTLFEIGSVTKVFTALVLADMVHRKELEFDDPVERHLPAGFTMPQRNGHVITLADLATHTSGLPYFPFSVITTPNPLEALARFTVADLRTWLAALSLPRDPGAQWEYSNLGYGVLGLALANKAGMPFEELLRQRVTGPLGLHDTTFHPTGEALRRLAAGHDAKLAPVAPIDLGIFAPAGALRSTVADQLRFLGALLPGSRSPLEAPAQLLLTIHRPAPAAGGEQALGWDMVTGGDTFFAKDGVTAGQAATIVMDPARQAGAVVLSNTFPVNLQLPPGGGVGAADLARHLIRPELPLG
ncbi:MAG TPA: serine hydrolase domain-containing protein [Burkholderiaceae bacterium]|jgi:CubicO group peptidase (beta-lactamase class C family)